MALVDQYALSQDATFRNRVQIAMAKAALAVSAEARTGQEIFHNKRLDLATRVLHRPGDWINQFAIGVATNAVITAASIDGDIEFQINAMWDAFASVNADEKV